jgi:Na+/phosphate symporter
MMIPQIRTTLTTVLIILIGVPLFTVFQLWGLGELHTFQAAWTFISHSFFNVCMVAVGWIFMRSPFASKLTEIVQSATSKSADGTVLKQVDTTVKVTEPISEKETAAPAAAPSSPPAPPAA